MTHADTSLPYVPQDIRLSTLPRFLLGSREAILDIAASRQSLILGAIFVLSAGFAREYDAEDLLHAPWYLIIPLAASLATSWMLYSLLRCAAKIHATNPPNYWPFYRRFLAVYWMTAPLAWIYAVPVEHYLSAADAVRANLWFLGVVALWRVLLITRATVVLFGTSYWAAFALVMFFADTLAMTILFFTPLPLFNIMGGIPLTESESVIRNVACDVQFFGAITWPVFFIATIVYMNLTPRKWEPAQFAAGISRGVTWPLWGLGALSLGVWAVILPMTQPAQQLRRTVEADLLDGRIEEALLVMTSHAQEDFPPHWDPPPWPGYGKDVPPLSRVLQATLDMPTADWVSDVFWEKLLRQIRDERTYFFAYRIRDEEFEAYMVLFEQLARGNRFPAKAEAVRAALHSYAPNAREERADRVRSVLAAVGEELPVQQDDDQDISDESSSL